TTPGRDGRTLLLCDRGHSRVSLRGETAFPFAGERHCRPGGENLPPSLRPAGLRRSGLWRRDRLASGSRARPPRSTPALVQGEVSRLRTSWRFQDHLGTEPPPAFHDP